MSNDLQTITPSQLEVCQPTNTYPIKQAQQTITYKYESNKPSLDMFDKVVPLLIIAGLILAFGIVLGRRTSETSRIGDILEKHDEKVLKEAFKQEDKIQQAVYIRPFKRED